MNILKKNKFEQFENFIALIYYFKGKGSMIFIGDILLKMRTVPVNYLEKSPQIKHEIILLITASE